MCFIEEVRNPVVHQYQFIAILIGNEVFVEEVVEVKFS